MQAMPPELRSAVGGYREYAAPDHLDHVAEGFWVHSPQPAPGGAPVIHRILPHFCVSLCLERVRHPDGSVAAASLSYRGPVARTTPFVASDERELIAVRLRPELSRGLLEVDPAAHWDGGGDFHQLAPGLARQLAAAVASADSVAEVHAAFDAWLSRRVAAVVPSAPTVVVAMRQMVEELRRSHGAERVEALAQDSGWSVAYLRRLFRLHLGIGPKRLARLFRLNAAFDLADRSRRPDWASIAARLWYADQAHLVNECRHLTGCSPGRLHRERHSDGAAFGGDG